jgi:poly-gamma-glutamate synthesis protein (capsule biosynthesis protein)
MTTIIIGGDVCPMGRIQNDFIEGNAEAIFHDLLDEISTADLSVVNLECPLVSEETPIDKGGGEVLGVSYKSIKGFKASRWHVLNLANNHSFDHGDSGLQETINTIKSVGLHVVGAGSNIYEAQKPLINEINGERIVIYSMAEREFSIADEQMPGANPLDLINFVNAIRQYKQQGIFIVLIHGGKEYYPYPTPEMVRRCRFMVDMGADAVICCHAHCPLPWEVYAERPIIYGLGNLIFESDSEQPDVWYKGYLAKLSIGKRQIKIDLIPHLQSQEWRGVKKMDEFSRKQFLNEMERRNEQMKDMVFLKDQWAKYCQQQKINYLSLLFGYNRPMRKLRKLLLPLLHSPEAIQQALLLVQCETHQELLTTIFRDERNNGGN